MDRVLIDTSTFVDISRAPKRIRDSWAANTIGHLVQYQTSHSKLTVGAFTVFEHLDGLHRVGQHEDAKQFSATIEAGLEVIYPDEAVFALAAQIQAALAVIGKTIGVPDTFIAATAITHGLTLVNANTKHFERVSKAGFPLRLANWREE